MGGGRRGRLSMPRLGYDDRGTGKPALLLHGFPCTRLFWKTVAEQLSQSGFRCVVPDLLGYGASPAADDVGMAAQLPPLIELLDSLGLGRVDVVAHDVGTAAAQLLAVRHPDRIRRLILMDGVYETEWAMA